MSVVLQRSSDDSGLGFELGFELEGQSSHLKTLTAPLLKSSAPGNRDAQTFRYLIFTKGSPLDVLQHCQQILRDGYQISKHAWLTMVSNELVEQLRKLDRVDKLQIIQFLAAELANEENNLIKSGASYPVWSPYDAVEAANIMLKALNAETSLNHE